VPNYSMHYVDRVRVGVLGPVCHLVGHGIESWVSERPVEFNDGGDTMRVRKTCGWNSSYWIILPESTQL
jgi:hypothetical protein